MFFVYRESKENIGANTNAEEVDSFQTEVIDDLKKGFIFEVKDSFFLVKIEDLRKGPSRPSGRAKDSILPEFASRSCPVPEFQCERRRIST